MWNGAEQNHSKVGTAMKNRTDRTLQITPIARYRVPRYPDADAVCAHPALLANIPKRWHDKPAVCAALFATLALGLSGCSAQPSIPTKSITSEPKDSTKPQQSAPISKPVLSIPVFSHGEGRGSFGCVSVAPPVFLSEEEAAQVIREEALAYNVDFSANATVDSNRLPYTNLLGGVESQTAEDKRHSGKLKLDGYDAKTGMGFEFVSVDDVKEWQDPNLGMFSSVESYEGKRTAERLADALVNVAVFYDPMSADYKAFDFTFDWESAGQTDEERNEAQSKAYEAAHAKYDAQQRQKSMEELRAQVRDFFEWLKGQGVI